MLRTVSFVERHDLSIPQLEEVRIETKVGQDKLLTGSFYVPPNSKSEYWDLIDKSIKNVSNTPHNFIVLGDFNTNFLSNPSPQLLDVINFSNPQQVGNSSHTYYRNVSHIDRSCTQFLYGHN